MKQKLLRRQLTELCDLQDTITDRNLKLSSLPLAAEWGAEGLELRAELGKAKGKRSHVMAGIIEAFLYLDQEAERHLAAYWKLRNEGCLPADYRGLRYSNECLAKERDELRRDYEEAMRQYDEQQKRACEAERQLALRKEERDWQRDRALKAEIERDDARKLVHNLKDGQEKMGKAYYDDAKRLIDELQETRAERDDLRDRLVQSLEETKAWLAESLKCKLERNEARRWAKAWKKAAKSHRYLSGMRKKTIEAQIRYAGKLRRALSAMWAERDEVLAKVQAKSSAELERAMDDVGEDVAYALEQRDAYAGELDEAELRIRQAVEILTGGRSLTPEEMEEEERQALRFDFQFYT